MNPLPVWQGEFIQAGMKARSFSPGSFLRMYEKQQGVPGCKDFPPMMDLSCSLLLDNS
jgi:hypothetical protein